MITRLIAEVVTPIVTRSRSRILNLQGARGVVSNRPYCALEAPLRHRCRTTFIVKQGVQGLPVRFRAHTSYLHVDFKTPTLKQARRKLSDFLRLQWVDELTSWGYSRIRWVQHMAYHTPKPAERGVPGFGFSKDSLRTSRDRSTS